MMKISIYRRIFRESLTDGIFGTFFSVFKLYIQLLSFNQEKKFFGCVSRFSFDFSFNSV